MLVVDQVVVTDEVLEARFVCDLDACKGACCEAGDSGAPLEKEEVPIIEECLDKIIPYMSERGRQVLRQKGFHTIDSEGDLTTETVAGRECLFAVRDTKGGWACSIELAWKAGSISFQKPISCHLYPIRIKKTPTFDVLQYHRWNICKAACTLGENSRIPMLFFLKNALTRKYGNEWFEHIEHFFKKE